MITEEQYYNVMEGWLEFINKPENADELIFARTVEPEALRKLEEKIAERKAQNEEKL